ncbi:MAG: hypothetical protein Q9160_008249 [Pyrenula sp. 1 TL-2023]
MTDPSDPPCPSCTNLYTYPGPLILSSPERSEPSPLRHPTKITTSSSSHLSKTPFSPLLPALIIGLHNSTPGPQNEYLIQLHSRNVGSRSTTTLSLYLTFYLNRSSPQPLEPSSLQPENLLPFPRSCLVTKNGSERKWTRHNVLKTCRAGLAATLLNTVGLVGEGMGEEMKEGLQRIVRGETQPIERDMSERAAEVVRGFPPLVLETRPAW